jgi:hypothetical protein
LKSVAEDVEAGNRTSRKQYLPEGTGEYHDALQLLGTDKTPENRTI